MECQHQFVHGYCIFCYADPPPPVVYAYHKPYKTLCEHPVEAHYTGVVCGDEVVFCNFCTERVS